MFPAPSPNSQALFAQLASNGATPGTIDFHRTAMSAAAAKRDQQTLAPASVTSQPQDMANGGATSKPEHKAPAGPYDPTITTHDNDAANGLFMLAQGRNGVQSSNQYAVAPPQQGRSQPPLPPQGNIKPSMSPQMTNGHGSIAASSTRGMSEGSAGSEESEQPRPNTRGRGKRNSTAGGATTNGRRKADDQPKAPASKKTKTNGGGSVASVNGDMDMMDHDMHSDEEDMKINKDGTKTKMTDEEKRKNFLERNRYLHSCPLSADVIILTHLFCRVAALKCRQRKKQWLANLQNKVELFSSENDQLTAQITQLREEVVNLKTLLLAHKDCPVTQQQGLHGAFMQQPMEPYNPQMNPYSMGGPMNSQPVMAGQGGPRRFS